MTNTDRYNKVELDVPKPQANHHNGHQNGHKKHSMGVLFVLELIAFDIICCQVHCDSVRWLGLAVHGCPWLIYVVCVCCVCRLFKITLHNFLKINSSHIGTPSRVSIFSLDYPPPPTPPTSPPPTTPGLNQFC